MAHSVVERPLSEQVGIEVMKNMYFSHEVYLDRFQSHTVRKFGTIPISSLPACLPILIRYRYLRYHNLTQAAFQCGFTLTQQAGIFELGSVSSKNAIYGLPGALYMQRLDSISLTFFFSLYLDFRNYENCQLFCYRLGHALLLYEEKLRVFFVSYLLIMT